MQHRARFNAAIKDWGRMTRTQYLYKLRLLPFKQRVFWKSRALNDVLRGQVGIGFKEYYGNVVRVKWPFARHGIFQEHGVGRGRPLGSNNTPRPWIENTLDTQTKILANSLQDENIKSLGMVINIKINGIFELKL